ncbi:MAG: c-type cytochrome domain-containing protein [Verrucomicrobiota bacterium]
MKLDGKILKLLVAGYLVLSLAFVALAWWVSRAELGELPALLQVGGNMHPLLLHLPIGAFIYVLVAELVNVWMGFTRYQWRIKGSLPLLGFGALSSYAAAVVGLLLYLQGEYSGDLIDKHLWWGVGFAIASGLVFLVALAVGFQSLVYRGVLFGSTAAMMVTGHFGGLITHGDPLEPLLIAAKEEEAKSPDELLIYEDVVTVVLQENCYQCHAADKKQKSGLLMDSYDALLVGGDTGPALVPGSLEESLMSEYWHLPEDDDLHMPPEGKAPLTEQEKAFIDAWIEAGAPQNAKLVDSGMDEALVVWAIDLLTVNAEGETEVVQALIPVDPKLAQHIEQVEQALGLSVSRYGPQGDVLSFTAVNFREAMDDSKIEQILIIAPHLVDVDLSQTEVTTDGAVKVVTSAGQLKRLNLARTQIDDRWVASAVDALASLESLNLYGTQISSESVPHLVRLKQLKQLYLGETQLSEEDLKSIRTQLPDTVVMGGI